MTIFDLVFIGVFLASVGTLAVVLVHGLRGRRRRGTRLLARWGMGIVVYLAAIIAVSLVSPQRIVAVGENQCFDDWCIAVDDVERSVSASAHEATLGFPGRVIIGDDGSLFHKPTPRAAVYQRTSTPTWATTGPLPSEAWPPDRAPARRAHDSVRRTVRPPPRLPTKLGPTWSVM